jgi:5-oxoprolinase (ATP-hydrolysing) subunit C
VSAALRVLVPGPFTTLQDGGRVGWLRYGVPGSGALDPRALAVANLLVGNPPEAGALELTLGGAAFTVEGGAVRLAVAGAEMPLAIDGHAAAGGRSHRLAAGAVLRIGAARAGARAYLAVSGGFSAAPVFGSVATHMRAGIGGFAGRTLAAGDFLPVAGKAPAGPERRLAGDLPPAPARLRVVLGPQDEYFTAEAVAALVGSAYRVGARSDRMGYRLEGPALAHARGFNVISDAIAPGSIQLPGDGQPIVLLADRQTTGGYPKIATIISADLAALGQMRPGDSVRFEAVGLDEARAARQAMKDWFEALPARIVLIAFDSEALLGQNLISGITDGES